MKGQYPRILKDSKYGEAARHLYAQFEGGWDIMLVARSAILAVKEPQVEEALVSLLNRARLST